jgi:hypothetical protein
MQAIESSAGRFSVEQLGSRVRLSWYDRCGIERWQTFDTLASAEGWVRFIERMENGGEGFAS